MVNPAERRKHERFALPCRVSVELPAGGDVRGRTVNVSDGGACFITETPPAVGGQVCVRLTVPRDTANTFFLEQFAAKAFVVRCEPAAEGSAQCVALRFEKELALDLR